MNEVYEAIKKLRTAKGYSQEYMATKLGVTQGSYGRIERGETTLTIERLSEIANVLGSTTEQIFSSELVNESNSNLNKQIAVCKARINELEKDIESLKHYNSLLQIITQNFEDTVEKLLENYLLKIQNDWIKENGPFKENDRDMCFSEFFHLKPIKTIFQLSLIRDPKWVTLWKQHGPK